MKIYRNLIRYLRREKLQKHAKAASIYIRELYIEPNQPSGINFCISWDSDITQESEEHKVDEANADKHVQYSDREPVVDIQTNFIKKQNIDPYDAKEVTKALRKSSNANSLAEMLEALERNVNQSFVDRLLYYINQKGLRDSEVYKAAQVDKRLFSKMVSNREYKPSKDTAIAMALALKLSLDEANDLLSRAGYTFSHSNKRDIIIEYFFREKVYSLIDANDVLYRLNQKLIGRS